ncbi:MAG TPA: hypothetical protein PLC98_13845 [Anaerolineales bacterium]|nr:hypothetical protein [Anaerolineales bacterium]
MSGIDERMKHSSMDAMDQAFTSAQQQLQTTQETVKKITSMVSNGALDGDAGTALEDALNQKLMKALQVLEKKMAELKKDIDKAQQANREAERTAKGRFQ